MAWLRSSVNIALLTNYILYIITSLFVHLSVSIYSISVQHWPLFLSSIQCGDTFLCTLLCPDLMPPPKASFSHCMCHPVGSPLFIPCGRRPQAYSTAILTPWADRVKYMPCTSQLSIPLSFLLCTPLPFSFVIRMRLVKFCRDLMPPTLSIQSHCSHHVLLLAMLMTSCPSCSTGITKCCQKD